MKIGILTQPLHYNYGGIIQNWALQQVLKRCGYEPEMVFLVSGEKADVRLLALRALSLIKCLAKKYVLNQEGIYLHSPFDPRYCPSVYYYADSEFIKRINKTKPLGRNTDLAHLVNRRRYDAFIVGSDQVWREEYSPNIFSFFLDFLPKNDKRRRIAYAASFGKESDYISLEKMPQCRKLLTRFDAVSVRENEGIEIINNDFGRQQVEKVLDPTLLLSSVDYDNLISPDDHKTKPFIASYILDNAEEKESILKAVSSVKDLPISKMSIDIVPGSMASISQWLANFADADFVVTDSFHGCVFSIIFGKPFIAVANKERGLDRFTSLLGEFELTNRLISNYHEFRDHKDILLSMPDYNTVNSRLETLRQSSLKFLTNALA